MKTHSLYVALCLIVLSALPVQAERVWDNELKRFLTDQEMSMAEVFMTEDEGIKVILPKSERVRKDVIRLNPERKSQIEERIGWRFPEEEFEVYIGETGTRIDGYAIVQNTIGKHKPMTYMVGVDGQGSVSDIELLVFRESRGSEIRQKRFNSQYEGKTVLDPVRINKDIINISGATMSVRSMSAGIKRVLVLVDEFYLKPVGRGSDTIAARKSEKGFFGSLFGSN